MGQFPGLPAAPPPPLGPQEGRAGRPGRGRPQGGGGGRGGGRGSRWPRGDRPPPLASCPGAGVPRASARLRRLSRSPSSALSPDAREDGASQADLLARAPLARSRRLPRPASRPASRPLGGGLSRGPGAEGDRAERAALPTPPSHVGPALAAAPPRDAPALGAAPCGPPGRGPGGRGGRGPGRPGVRWPREFPGAGPTERAAGDCVHAPLTQLHAAGQPLITRGPASPLAGASHTFAAHWPPAGPAPAPARGARQAERLPEWGGGRRRGARRRRVSPGARARPAGEAAPRERPRRPDMLNFGASLQQATVRMPPCLRGAPSEGANPGSPPTACRPTREHWAAAAPRAGGERGRGVLSADGGHQRGRVSRDWDLDPKERALGATWARRRGRGSPRGDSSGGR